jgi:hypothetical protein
MRLPDDLLLSISANLTHERDFTFYAKNGEIANRIREELEKRSPSILNDIELDSDGDVRVKTGMGSFYVSPTGVTASAWLIELKELREIAALQEYSRAIDLLFHAGSSFQVKSHSVRLLFRFTPANGVPRLKSGIIDSALRTILGDKAPDVVTTFKTSVMYWRGEQFLDTLELDAVPDQTQIRYNRTSLDVYESFQGFLEAANLNGIVGDIESFLQTLQDNVPRSSLRKLAKP